MNSQLFPSGPFHWWELEAKLYEGKVKSGNILISVHTEDYDDISRARSLFERMKAEDVTSTTEAAVPMGDRRP